jgi:hypothetical protein
MHHNVSQIKPWAWASVSAAIATAAILGTFAEVVRRKAQQIATLDPAAPYDPYFGLAEYALAVEPA